MTTSKGRGGRHRSASGGRGGKHRAASDVPHWFAALLILLGGPAVGVGVGIDLVAPTSPPQPMYHCTETTTIDTGTGAERKTRVCDIDSAVTDNLPQAAVGGPEPREVPRSRGR